MVLSFKQHNPNPHEHKYQWLHSPDVHFNNIHFVNSANDERLESQKVKK